MPNVPRKRDLPKLSHIVVIDDDESVRRGLKSLIRAIGYSADVFGSAEAFLKSDMIQTTSCLISDVQMPEMSGIELQQRLSTAGHRTPIIFITGSPNEATRLRVLRNGAIDYLRKPVAEKNLLASLNRALKLPH
jgi:FixJ family two-component response regulator